MTDDNREPPAMVPSAEERANGIYMEALKRIDTAYCDGWNARAALDAPPDPELAESRREAEQCRADAEEARASMRRLQRAGQDQQREIERLREALTAARAQGHAAGVREGIKMAAAAEMIRALGAPEPQE